MGRKVGFRREDGEDGMSKAATEALEEDGFESGWYDGEDAGRTTKEYGVLER